MDLDYIPELESNTARSLGLIGMRERAESSWRKFSIESVSRQGTKVKLIWPKVEKSPPSEEFLLVEK
jgi:signal transduction histidine kinase